RCPADLAYQVPVRLGRQVVGRRAVPEVGVHHDAEALELLEIAVHRRGVDVRRQLADDDEQLLRGRVVRTFDQRGEHEAAGGGDPRAAVAELGDQFVDGGAHDSRIAATGRHRLSEALGFWTLLRAGRVLILWVGS